MISRISDASADDDDRASKNFLRACGKQATSIV
jgi:hypothetical protein